MSDVQFSIGGSAAPFKSALKEATEAAKESGAKISESFGIEGVKSERALHTRFLGAFKDITAGGKSSAEAIGGAFENLTEGLRLSLGSMVALLAVSELVKSVYEGYEAFNKMREAGENALSINEDITSKSFDRTGESAKKAKEAAAEPVQIGVQGDEAKSSIEQVGEAVESVQEEANTPTQLQLDAFVSESSVEKVKDTIKKLQDDAKANDLSANSSILAGPEILIQALAEEKSISAAIREDAEKTFDLNKEAHDLEDAASAKTIKNENDVLQLKLGGYDKEAEALSQLQEMQAKLADAQDKHDQETIDALTKQIELQQQLNAAKIEKKEDDKLASLQKDEQAEQDKQDELGKTDAEKLADIQAKVEKDQDALNAKKDADTPKSAFDVEVQLGDDARNGTSNKTRANEEEALKLQILKDQTKEKELQAALTKSNADLTKDLLAEERRAKEAGETEAQKLQDSKDAVTQDKSKLDAAKDDGSLASTQNLLKLRLQYEKDITAQREQQTKYDAEQEKRAKLLTEQKEAQQAVQATALDAKLFHGEVSSLAKTGLGGRVSGPNYGNQAQLKASQDAAKHLADIKAQLAKLGSIGVAGS